MLKITEEMRAAARKLVRDPALALKINASNRKLLTALADGKRKLIDAHWWKKHFVVVDRMKLDKLQRLADPAGNPNEHERAVAKHKHDEFKARRAPGLPPEPPPLPKTVEEMLRGRKVRTRRTAPRTPPKHSLLASDGGVNTKAATGSGGVSGKAKTSSGGVNTKPERTGDRHRNKGDRHKPGYMRDYMRRRRAQRT